MTRTLIGVVVSALATTGTASADQRSEADAHARRGVALYNLGKYEEAIVSFEQAYTLVPSDALLFNLAQAHRKLEHCELAVQYYKRFMDGDPAPALVAQVAKLLPKLEAACRTTHEQPDDPAPVDADARARVDLGAGMPTARVVALQPGADEPVSPPAIDEAPDVASEPDEGAPTAFRLYAAAGLTAGTVIAGGTAPTAGGKVALASPVSVLGGGELGAAIRVGRMWRDDADHDATIASVAASIHIRSELDWGRLTIGGEVGAAYFSSLDSSSGVVPGLSRAAVWVPEARVEVGGEHDVASALALRVGLAVGVCPRVGPMLSTVGQLELLLGLRYSR